MGMGLEYVIIYVTHNMSNIIIVIDDRIAGHQPLVSNIKRVISIEHGIST